MNALYAPEVPHPPFLDTSQAGDADMTWTSPHPVDVATTVARLGRGPGDPTHRVGRGGDIWRTARTAEGTATLHLQQLSRETVACQAWGAGATAVLAGVPDLLGARDDHTQFDPRIPALAEAHRTNGGLRIPRTGYVLDCLIGAVIEQRVITLDAHAAWRRLLLCRGDEPPGPAPSGMRIPLSPAQWLAIPSWEWHRSGVDATRARTALACAHVAGRVEETTGMTPSAARARLMAIPGVGPWTAAEVAQRALGDADAVSVGDYHLAATIGYAFVGEAVDDARMLEILEPWRPFRYRVIRLLETAGRLRRPSFGPRAPRDRSYLL